MARPGAERQRVATQSADFVGLDGLAPIDREAAVRRIKPRLNFARRVLDEIRHVVRHCQIKKIGAYAGAQKWNSVAGRPAAAAVSVLLTAAAAGTGWYAYRNLAAAPASAGQAEPARLAALTVEILDPEAPASTAPRAAAREEVDLDAIAAVMDPFEGEQRDLDPRAAVEVPRIAVLPLAQLDNGNEAGYFSEGVAESLIRHLGSFPHLTVLASASTFAYGLQDQEHVEIAEELGATHLVRGSAGRIGNEMVVRAELLDAATGEPLWPEPVEVRTEDPGAAQRQLGQRIFASLGGREAEVTPVDLGGLSLAGTLSLAAYDHALQWRDLFEASQQGSNLRARQAALRALEIDPGYAAAYAYVAWTFMADYWWRWSSDATESLRQALRWAQKAVEIDPGSFDAHWALGDVYQAMGEVEQAVQAYEAALAINPNAAELLQDLGTRLLPLQGRAEEGLELAQRSRRLNPHHSEDYYGNVSFNHYLLGRYADVVDNVNRMRNPRLDHMLYLTASYAQIGRELEAKLLTAHVLAENPDLTADSFLGTLPFKDDADAQRLREGLIKAGLPA